MMAFDIEEFHTLLNFHVQANKCVKHFFLYGLRTEFQIFKL